MVAGEDEEEEAEMVVGRERKSGVDEGAWSTSIGSDDWRVKLGVVMALPYKKIWAICTCEGLHYLWIVEIKRLLTGEVAIPTSWLVEVAGWVLDRSGIPARRSRRRRRIYERKKRRR